MAESNTVFLHAVLDKSGDQYFQTTLTPAEDQREKVILAKPYVIPVLFLPGIMGTNLRKTVGKEIAWRPPNTDLRGLGDALLQLINYLFKSTEQRAADLATNSVEIDPRGPIDAGECGLPRNVLVARGWGALMRSSYHPFMAKLQCHLNNLAQYDFERCEADLKQWAAEAGLDAPTEWGAKGGEPLTREEILHAANYQFDIWAGGYNWLQSNRDSGAAIRDLINNTILPYYNEGRSVVVTDTPDGDGNNQCSIQRRKPNRPIAEKVIVVTHSMGGLVSRALTEVHHCEAVLGVSHGVQPATGAPATYKRMRAGFESVEQVILGRNAADVVAVLSQAPGGLELLPTADYNDGKPWLFVREKKGSEPILALPEHGDPYGEIYQSTAWYGLVPDGNDRLLNACNEKPAPGFPNVKDRSEDSSPRGTLTRVLTRVKAFHEEIEKRYKQPTYVHYGAQGKRTPDGHAGCILGTGILDSKDRFAWGEIAWEGRDLNAIDPMQITIVGDDGNGTLKTASGTKLTLSAPDCPGDGTVPFHSGAAPGKAGVALSFAHGHGSPGRHNQHFGYDHQESYGDEHQRSLYATMYAVVKIAQRAAWHKKKESV